MINGCFDLFHPGHLYLIKKAKKLGDFLIIGITSDKARIKQGNRKPIIPEKERKKILEAIRYVDKVEIYNGIHPYKMFKKYKPDIIVLGKEGKNEMIKQEGMYEKAKIIPRGKWSTTKLIDKIRR